MNYYRLNNGFIEKYKISFDEEEIKKIIEKSIYQCGKKELKEIKMSSFLVFSEYVKILKKEDAGWREYDDGPDVRLTKYTYIEYQIPNLGVILKNILASTNIKKNIEELFIMDLSKEFNGFDNEIERKLESIKEIKDENYNEKINALNELKKLYEQKEFNKDRENIKDYYLKAINLIKIEFIDKIPLEEYNRVHEFIEEGKFKSDGKDLILIMKGRKNDLFNETWH